VFLQKAVGQEVAGDGKHGFGRSAGAIGVVVLIREIECYVYGN